MMWIRLASFWVYPLLSVAMVAGAAVHTGLQPLQFSLVKATLAGLAVWSFLEYVLHRFLFHWRPRNAALKQFLATLHIRHHGDPRNGEKILVRLRYSLPVSALAFVSMLLVSGSWLLTSWFQIGVWMGFLYYEAVHYRIHMSKRSGGLLGFQRRGHFYHHFVNDDFCFGVTSPIWDWVFGTYKTVEPSSQREE